MISFLIIWLILLVVCLCVGLLILNICNISPLIHRYDLTILAIWLGIVILCLNCITLALFVPLSPLTGAILSLFWVLIALFSTKIRAEFNQLLKLISLQNFIKGLIIASAIALFTTQQIIWFDTGLYHLGSIRWIAEFGSVRGVTLINSKFGFTSSWFAFSAPLILDWENGKISAISNGFLMLVIFLHLLIIFTKLKSKNLTIADVFISFFIILIMTFYIFDNFHGNSLVSFSNDIPVSLLIGVTSWSMLIINEHSYIPSKQFKLNSHLIPVILSIGAFTIKLTAIPFLATIILFYFWQNRPNVKHFLIIIFLTFILILPNSLFAIKTSGCPMYPSSKMCLNVPWRIKAETIKKENVNITGIDREKTKYNPIINLIKKRWSWFKSSFKIQITVGLYLLSIILSILIVKQKNIKLKLTQSWLVFLSIFGVTFVMMIIPLIRFAVGYFLVSISLFFANFSLKVDLFNTKIWRKFNQFSQEYLIIILTVSLFVIGGKNLDSRLFFPAKLPELPLINAENNDVKYTYPADFQIKCWGADLPCSALPIENSIQLVDGRKGFKSGFQYRK
ncbi:LIC_10190 family membrane protein [Geminocystis sp. GBBB08]|uniref:LIC_10190 family membrane protein n=1 Tax=Geminocystis sp. GBBB08 TaxID=2604140 RepID=UPI0027E29DE6|nr:hypothetical protein [Geminocystis sp. GBBB08]MBL1211116.1 hypothetical protein [Geminocystis sp. GBBB08]